MFVDLSRNALILAQKKQKQKNYQPKNIRKLWNIDTEEKQVKRIGLLFGNQDLKNQKKETIPTISKVKNNISLIVKNNNEDRYLEIREIITQEISSMVSKLNNEAYQFIVQDGKRFGIQFIEFLIQKYGSKIYYLLESQLKNDIVADRFSDDIAQSILKNLNPPHVSRYLVDFFEAIFITLEKKGLEF
jgi:gas vesicle protein